MYPHSVCRHQLENLCSHYCLQHPGHSLLCPLGGCGSLEAAGDRGSAKRKSILTGHQESASLGEPLSRLGGGGRFLNTQWSGFVLCLKASCPGAFQLEVYMIKAGAPSKTRPRDQPTARISIHASMCGHTSCSFREYRRWTRQPLEAPLAPQLYDLLPINSSTTWSLHGWDLSQLGQLGSWWKGRGGFACSLPDTGGAIPRSLDDDYRTDGDGWAGCQLAFLIRAVHEGCVLRVTLAKEPAAALGRGEAVGLGWSWPGVRVSI